MPGAKIPQDWDGETWVCWSVEWPDSRDWFALLRGFLTTPKMGRYWDGETGSVVDAQVVGVEIMDRNIVLEEVLMACNDGAIAALEAIAAAIGAAQTGGSSCCVLGGETDVTDVDDGPGEDVPLGEEFPPGFADRAEFDSYRCKASYWLIRNYTQTLRNWAGLFGTVGGLTIGVISALMLLTVPPVGLMVIVAALGVLVGVDIGLLIVLEQISDGIDEDIDELACCVYNASSSSDAAQCIRDKASEVIGELAPALAVTYEAITDNLISNDQADVLVNKDPSIDALPEEDCSACEPTCSLILEHGTLVSGSMDEPGTVVIDSVEVTGRHGIHILGSATCWKHTAASNNGASPQWWAEGSTAGCTGGDVPFYQAGTPTIGECYNATHYYGDDTTFGPFQITITWECC